MKLLSPVARCSSGSSYFLGASDTGMLVVDHQYQDSPGGCVTSRTPPCPKNHGLSTITDSEPGSVVTEWQPETSAAAASSIEMPFMSPPAGWSSEVRAPSCGERG